jgi:hypothetical protein
MDNLRRHGEVRTVRTSTKITGWLMAAVGAISHPASNSACHHSHFPPISLSKSG